MDGACGVISSIQNNNFFIYFRHGIAEMFGIIGSFNLIHVFFLDNYPNPNGPQAMIGDWSKKVKNMWIYYKIVTCYINSKKFKFSEDKQKIILILDNFRPANSFF